MYSFISYYNTFLLLLVQRATLYTEVYFVSTLLLWEQQDN